MENKVRKMTRNKFNKGKKVRARSIDRKIDRKIGGDLGFKLTKSDIGEE